MRYSVVVLILVALLPLTTLAIPHESNFKVRQNRPDDHALNQKRADAVKEAFTFAWSGYQKYAFPNDELHPVTNEASNSRNAWGASAVDALSTALLMQIPDIVDTILNFIPTINFDKTSTQVSLFETTIRYMGGMLSGYDLLKGPLAKYGKNSTQVEALLKQTERLANNLAFAFDTPSGIPSNNLYFNPSRTDGSTTNGLATVGTLVLEWTRLSDLTGNPRYARLAEKGESYLLTPKPATSEPFPGLLGMNIDINTGLFQDAFGGWVGGADSFYEYLIKMYVYDTGRFESYKDRWLKAADSTIANLASHPSSRQDVTYLAAYNGKKLIFESQHLACFDGGNFILAGLTLKQDKYVKFGLELVEGCHNTYSSTLTKIGPEAFRWVEKNTASNDSSNPQPPSNQAAFYQKAGFYLTSAGYVLRPEVIESFYYAYRATGNQVYRDWAWEAFVAINATCRIGSGFAGLNNVNAANGGGYQDFQESFFFAEVMKYSYLIHAPDNVWQVEYDGKNQYVYNTEAHPFKVFGPPI